MRTGHAHQARVADPISVTVTQASTITGISTERLTDLLDEGVISSYYEGLLRIVSFSSLADYIQARLTSGGAA